jgi:hypothetical protein
VKLRGTPGCGRSLRKISRAASSRVRELIMLVASAAPAPSCSPPSSTAGLKVIGGEGGQSSQPSRIRGHQARNLAWQLATGTANISRVRGTTGVMTTAMVNQADGRVPLR